MRCEISKVVEGIVNKLIVVCFFHCRLVVVWLLTVLSLSVEVAGTTRLDLSKIMEDVISCKYMVKYAYAGNSAPRHVSIDEKYEKLGEFTRFPNQDAMRDRDRFMQSNGISRESFDSVLGHVYDKRDKSGTFIAFRGTVYKDEWVSNLDAEASSASLLCTGVPGYVHKGFLEGVCGFCRYLEEAFINTDRFKDPNYEVVFTGHSRGGAFALLYAVRLQKVLQDKGLDAANRIKVITFSAPEDVIGDAVFWRHYYSKIGGMNIVMFSNDLDIVPNIGASLSRVRLGYVSPTPRGRESDESFIFSEEGSAFGINVPVVQSENAVVLVRNIVQLISEPDIFTGDHSVLRDNLQRFVGALACVSEVLAFTHSMLPDMVLCNAFRSALPRYIKRWTGEVYFPRELPFIPEPEISRLCASHLSGYQHNDSGRDDELLSEKVDSFLKRTMEISQNPHIEEKRMRFVHYIISHGINLIAISPILRDVEMDWRRSIGLT